MLELWFNVQARVAAFLYLLPGFVGDSYDAAAWNGCMTRIGQLLAQS